jgi:hypothetical protein
LYNRNRSPEVDDVERLAASATKHLELLKQKDEAESSFIIENIVGKLLSRTLDLFHFIYPLQDSNGLEFYLHSDPEETKPFKLSPKMENLTSPCTVFSSIYVYLTLFFPMNIGLFKIPLFSK